MYPQTDVLMMLFRGVIVEGVACSGKTSALRALLAHPSFAERQGMSSLVLTEHHTQRVLEGRGPRSELRVEDSVELLREHVRYVRGLRDRLLGVRRWEDANAANPRIRVVLERFHLTHALNYEKLAWEDVDEIDAELAEMGFVLCILTVSQPGLESRLAERGTDWGTFLAEKGHRAAISERDVPARRATYFAQQQDDLLALAARTRLPTLLIETSTLSPSLVCERLLGLLGLDP